MNKPTKSSPLTIELDVELIERLNAFKERTSSSSVSAIVRSALEEFNFEDYKASTPKRKQISVRMSKTLSDELKKAAKVKGVSAGEVVRESILSFLENNDSSNNPSVVDGPRREQKKAISLSEKLYKDDDETNPWQI